MTSFKKNVTIAFMITDEELLQYHAMGLIPGPFENEEHYLQRIAYCKNLVVNPPQFTKDQQLIKLSLKHIEHLYGINPVWVPLFQSNCKLPPWQGACTWIFLEKQGGPHGAAIQISKQTLYTQDEILAHELVHVGRMMYEEPKYEELLAYATSSSHFRRLFGPIVQSSKEVLWFMIILIALICADAVSLISGHLNLIPYIMLLKSIPVMMILYALFRLVIKHKHFNRCKKLLEKTTPSNATKILYLLTDHEIDTYSEKLFNTEDNSLHSRLIRLLLY